MAIVEDIIFESIPNSDKEALQILNGDFVVKASDQMHIQHILKAYPGQFYQHPLVGLGVRDYQAASVNPQRLKQAIKTQLKADNIITKEIQINEDFVVNIDAERLR
jgi:hypothetical protein